MSAGCAPPPLDPTANHDRYLRQRRVLWIVLVVNATMFCVEIVAGMYASSTALLADALDFLADSATYALTLYVLTRSARWKASAALIKGGAMMALGLWVVFIAIDRAFDPSLPDALTMGGIGVMALCANLGSAALLYWHRSDDLNMRSVWLCSRNDAIANLGVLAAAGGVLISATAWPDLMVGALIAGLEFSAGWSVMRQALRELRTAQAAAE